jgi:hypothetical protein
MLNNHTLAPLWPGGQRADTINKKPASPRPAANTTTGAGTATAAPTVHRELLSWQPAILGRFLAGLALVSVIFCAYLWQLSSIATIEVQTGRLRDAATRLEYANVDLMLQASQAEAPAQVDVQARALGMRPMAAPVYVTVQKHAAASAPAALVVEPDPTTAHMALWWQPVVALLAGHANTQDP